MIHEDVKPSAWHVAPDGGGEACAVCGCPLKYLGRRGTTQHRPADPAAPDERGWFTRSRSASFWNVKQVGVAKSPAPKQPKPRPAAKVVVTPSPRDKEKAAKLEALARERGQQLRDTARELKEQAAKVKRLETEVVAAKQVRAHVPTGRISNLMGKAAYLIAHGRTVKEAADALGVRYAHVCDWQNRWRDTWKALQDRAAEGLVESIRAMAGTAAVLDDPDAHCMRAAFVDDWAKRRGIDLFPISKGKRTLCQFFEAWYLPQCLFDGRESTKGLYRQVLNKWRFITGDPPVKKITPELLALFRDARLKMRGIKRHLPVSPNTVRTDLRVLQTLLDKLGPPGRRNRDALGVLERVPWVRPPCEEYHLPRTIELQQLSGCLLASVAMDVPRTPGVKPPAWWRALLTVAWNTGLRRGSLLSMRFSDVDWKNARAVLPGSRMKSRRPIVVHLNAPAMEALRSIRTDRELVFPWPHHRRYFCTALHRLQTAAGIPTKEHFGLHTIRKTVATLLWEINPGAAQFALGHTTNAITKKHYVDGGKLVARALDQLPQPEPMWPRPPIIGSNGNGNCPVGGAPQETIALG